MRLLQSLERDRLDALFVAGDAFFTSRRVQMANLAARNRIPAAYGDSETASAGGLMSYGADLSDSFRQIGVYTCSILKGAKVGKGAMIPSQDPFPKTRFVEYFAIIRP